MNRQHTPGTRTAGQAGFTLVETMVTLVITTIVVVGIYAMFNTMHKWSITTGIKSEAQQNARIGLETFTRDLEMAGYQTTNYGDASAAKSNLAITLAETNAIEMDQQRMMIAGNNLTTATYEPRLVYYHTATDATTGKTNLYRQVRSEPGLPRPDELVAENVTAFTLTYLDKDNNPVTSLTDTYNSSHYTRGVARPTPNDPLKSIRRVTVTLTTTASRADVPIGTLNPTYTLKASVMPQNMENPETALDAAPPATPKNLNVIDSRSCTTKLQAKWAKNTELDLAGYVLYYGGSDLTKNVNYPLGALSDRNNPAVTLNPADLFITKNADRTTTPNRYDIQIAAYDSSGNYSPLSAAVTGTNTDISAFVSPFPVPPATVSAAANDTTVNPFKPSKPTAVTVAAPVGSSGQLVVSWQPPADGTATVGYRLYRSMTVFPGGSHIPDTAEIANETSLTKDVTTYTENGLLGCTTYYYAVASVNCDETLVPTYIYNATGTSDYTVGNGQPIDTTQPPSPTLSGIAGWKRIFLRFDNPTVADVPDFNRTELWWTKGLSTPPHLNGTTCVVTTAPANQKIPDTDNTVAGSFTGRGTKTLIFDSETQIAPTIPDLDELGQYNLLAVSYDLCGNCSPASEQSIQTIKMCGDADNPGAPPNDFDTPTYSSCQPNTVELTWNYPRMDLPITDPAYIKDIAGFRVFRCDGSPSPCTYELTAAPSWLENFTDTGALQAGGTYKYEVRATDCVYENRRSEYPNNISSPYTIGSATTSGNIYPGKLERYARGYLPTDTDPPLENFVTTVSDAARPYTHHNNVKFYLQNSSQAAMTIERIAATWENPNVVLNQVVIGGGSSSSVEKVISVGGVTSGSPVTVNALIEDKAAGIGYPSGPIPVQLRFTTPSGTVNRLTDMRGETVVVSLWVQNASLSPPTCPDPDLITLDVPQGPLIGGFAQDSPGLFGIDSWEVIGAAGTARDKDIVVPGGRLVNVFGLAFDNSRDVFTDGINRGFSTLKLVTIDAAPAAPVASYMPATGTFVDRPLYQVSGDRYAIFTNLTGARMPVVSDRVNWYYALAVDRTGNWDRVPEPDFGSYAYYQLGMDVCSAPNPSAPVLTLVSTTSSSASLSWTAPTTYENNGGEIPSSDPLVYQLYYNHNGGSTWTPAGSEQSGTSLNFSGDMMGNAWYFMVKAKNTCTSSPKISVASNVVRECENTTLIYCETFAVTPASANVGAAFTIAAPNVCPFIGNGSPPDSVKFLVRSTLESKPFTVSESGDTGSFSKVFTTTAGTSGADQVTAAAGTTLYVDFYTIGATADTLQCTKTVSLTDTSGCTSRPKPPTSFDSDRGRTSGVYWIKLTWIAPNYNVDNTPVNLAGYEIDSARCSKNDWDNGECGNNDSEWGAWSTETVGLVTQKTFSGLVEDDRWKYRIRAINACSPVGKSDYKTEGPVRVDN